MTSAPLEVFKLKPKGYLAEMLTGDSNTRLRAGLVNLVFLSALKITDTILSYIRIDSRRCLWGENSNQNVNTMGIIDLA